MQRIVTICLIILFTLGNICYAQATGKHDRNNYYGISIGRVDNDAVRALAEQHGRDRRHHSHHKNRKHEKHHRNHDRDDNSGDIIKGIIILGIVKEILD